VKPAFLRIPIVCLTIGILASCAGVSPRSGPTPAMLAADSAIDAALTIEASIDPASFPATSVGVLPLRVAVADTMLAPLGYGMAELIMTDLARSRQLVVVDRLRVQSLVRELRLVESGVTDPAGGPRLGRILGARHLMLGSLASGEDARFRVDAHLARTEDASISALVTGAASLDDIFAAQKALVFRVFEVLGVTLTPAERAAVEQRPTRNLAALLAFSRGVQAEAELRLPEARREYAEALRLDRAFRLARERAYSIETFVPNTRGVATMTVSAINSRQPRSVSDVAEPAFSGRQSAIIVIPIIVR
jgi:TolB-like protein